MPNNPRTTHLGEGAQEEKKKIEKRKKTKNKGSHKPSGDDLLPGFSLALRVNTLCKEHQGMQIMSLCCVG